MTTLSVVIPAYNEEDGIEEISRRVLAVKPALAEVGVDDLELIVVDDGSQDRTGEIAASIEGVRLITQENKGYGGALKTGFTNAKGELIGINTITSSKNGTSVGIGFAIPIVLAKEVMAHMIEYGRVLRGWIGVRIQNISEFNYYFYNPIYTKLSVYDKKI